MGKQASSVPVSVAAKVYGKDPSWVRAGLISGYLPIGFATRNGERVTDVNEMNSKNGRINYYISPAAFLRDTGVYYGEKKSDYPWSNRNKELLYFCRQYPEWKKKLEAIESGSLEKASEMIFPKSPGGKSDVTSSRALARIYYHERIKIVDDVLETVEDGFKKIIFEYVTTKTTVKEVVRKHNAAEGEVMLHLCLFFTELGKRRQ